MYITNTTNTTYQDNLQTTTTNTGMQHRTHPKQQQQPRRRHPSTTSQQQQQQQCSRRKHDRRLLGFARVIGDNNNATNNPTTIIVPLAVGQIIGRTPTGTPIPRHVDLGITRANGMRVPRQLFQMTWTCLRLKDLLYAIPNKYQVVVAKRICKNEIQSIYKSIEPLELLKDNGLQTINY